ncbi:uncharacterized protein LOC121011704 [Herpailurus yagouaroundi]|uniref:uncharacterized protein LOC121011704 n=1 Tax=Herpailurus yagouaroundi TaxID=1608482 RepID=UPI001AD668BB|nr:uncharacterized protein LOC121011704 [Puma yagouaroundi]
MTEQRDGWPSQSWSCCSTYSPNKHVLVQGQRGGGCWLTRHPPRPRGPQPPCCSRVGRTARHLGPHRRRLPWARVSDDGAAAPPCCPAWEEECRASRDWVPTTFGKVLGAGKTGLALDLGEIAVDRRKRPPRLLDLFLLMNTHVFYQTTPLFEVQITERPQVVPAIATSHGSLISLHQQDCLFWFLPSHHSRGVRALHRASGGFCQLRGLGFLVPGRRFDRAAQISLMLCGKE